MTTRIPSAATAEGVPSPGPTRRLFLQNAASATAVVAVTAADPAVAVARIIGAADRPCTSEKFRGPGWYVFGQEGAWGKRAMYAGPPSRWNFIPISDGPDEKVLIEISGPGFDHACIWIMEPVPAGRVS